MTSFEKAGRWIFVSLAGLAAIFVLQFVVLRLHDSAVSRNDGLRIVWILLYLSAAIGIARWKPWAYLLGMLVATASVVSGVRGISRGSHAAVDGIVLALWGLCLVWLWLPGVREKFKPVTK
jgi:hypothetical protein